MKARKTLLCSALIWMACLPIFAQEIPPKEDVLRTMMDVNQHFMQKYADVSQTHRWLPTNIWTRAVYYEGLMALHQIFPREDYYNYALSWAEYHRWSFSGGNTVRNADYYCAGQVYIDLYSLSPAPEKLRNTLICMQKLVNTPQVNDWTWIDAIQMGMPVLAKLGQVTGDERYYEKMYAMYAHTRNKEGGKGLFDAAKGLWWRDKDFTPPYKEPNGKDCFWSRGNGWVYAALARVMSATPDNEKHRSTYLNDFKAMSAALKACQREDGFWNPSLLDPTNYGGKETTGTSLFVYGLAWGINNKVLDRATYLPVLLKAWQALKRDAVQPDGSLGYVQSTGKEPKAGQPLSATRIPDFEDFGTGCFLLGASEVYKLTEDE